VNPPGVRFASAMSLKNLEGHNTTQKKLRAQVGI
jgi:hypothetical protein